MVKEDLIKILENGGGEYLSGEQLAKRLGVSRGAVWKAIESLRGDGYEIEAVTNRGYRLADGCDVLSRQGVEKYLKTSFYRVETAGVVTSTNTLVRARAEKGEKEGYVLIAGGQTAGRGRMERTFYSPEDTGLYMSVLLRPARYSAQEAVRITTAAAVAMCRAIEDVSENKAEIKWVNDVFVGGKKVCGILTEASFSVENGSLAYVVLGVGVNAYEPKGGFPKELRPVAGAVYPSRQGGGKCRLAAAFLDRLFALYGDLACGGYMDDYRRRCFVIGNEADVAFAGGKRRALVLGVDGECRLIVRWCDDGSETTLAAGEISLRPCQ